MIGISVDAGFWTITIDRPDKANSLTAGMLEALCNAVDRAASEGARAVVITGMGRVFSAGADLDEARAGLARSPLWEALSSRIAALPCLTIAALNGAAAGGALGMVLACDLRIAVPGSKIFYPVMKLGFLPQASDVPRLVALVGRARASMILMTGAKVEAVEARDWGLIDRIEEDVLAAARDMATDSLGARDGHCAAIKAMITGAQA